MKSIPKLTSPSYIPTDDDILHVRIMTMGVVEHTFKIPLPSVHKGLHFSSPFKRKNAAAESASNATNSTLVGEDGGSVKSSGDSLLNVSGGGKEKSINMHIYDVGGARGQRHAWASFFEGATAVSITFFVPPFHHFIPFFHILPSRIYREQFFPRIFTLSTRHIWHLPLFVKPLPSPLPPHIPSFSK